jgi:outer membrane protein TolC
MTVDDTKREVRYMSLREAIAIALENGTVGAQSPATPGLATDTLGGFAGTTVQSADAIRVLALDPAIVANNIELSLAKFDTQWATSLMWNQTQTPGGLGLSSFGLTGAAAPIGLTSMTAGATGASSSSSSDTVTFNSGLVKPLPTGGIAGVTFGLSSEWDHPPGAVNPAIQPSIQFVFEQPLLQGFGVDINQLRDTHPGSILMPFTATNTGEGILIARIRSDQQRAEFERNLNFLLLNVEGAYWNLYGAYCQLYTREDAMRYAFESWRLTKLLFDAGRLAEQDMEQTRVQYEQFRSQRLTALGQVLESERQLRGLLNWPIEDGFRIVPTDAPTLVPQMPDWRVALNDALARRPELAIASHDVKFRQLDLIRQKNNLLPDLRFVGTDTLHSLGSQLDEGPVAANAFHQLVTNPFNNITLGLQLNVPIGYRAANVAVRNARLNLERSYRSLLTEEDKAERFLGLAYRQVFEFQSQIRINQAALRAATTQLERKFELIRQGRAPAYGADLILAEQNWSTSASSLYTAIVQYNNALATLDFARGTIQQRDNVSITDGPLPTCAQVRAVEHERQRTKALVLAQRASCTCPNSRPDGSGNPAADLPHLPVGEATPLPALIESRLPVPEPGPDVDSGPAAEARPAARKAQDQGGNTSGRLPVNKPDS